MRNYTDFYIDGAWVSPAGRPVLDVINPATELAFARISMGDATDVDTAVTAARRAFESFSQTTKADRIDLLRAVLAGFMARYDEVAEAITLEMGAPCTFSRAEQAEAGEGHLKAIIRALEAFTGEERINATRIVHEPVGVCGLITPWNWPINQVACKVAPALAAGCTMVLKPSEIAPVSAMIFAEILHDAGVPAGVFNLINGDGATVGAAISSHPGLDMVSFTGSTRAGIAIAKAAADTVKRVHQELGGKSANIILDDVDFEPTIREALRMGFKNSGQSCNSPSRLLVPRAWHDRAAALACDYANAIRIGDPQRDDTQIGPVVSKVQYDRIQGLIQRGIDQGAKLEAGGPGLPPGLNAGYFVRPTIFSGVTPDMDIARIEIFGPVVTIIAYDDEDEAIRIANDTVYGLANYVSSGRIERARAVARRLRSGMVHVNAAPGDYDGAFGGYKQSGNGREWGKFGFMDFMEVKSIFGYGAA